MVWNEKSQGQPKLAVQDEGHGGTALLHGRICRPGQGKQASLLTSRTELRKGTQEVWVK